MRCRQRLQRARAVAALEAAVSGALSNSKHYRRGIRRAETFQAVTFRLQGRESNG
jgi:hypothetical protein